MRNAVVLSAATLALALGGCASSKFVGRPDLRLVAADAMPAPTAADFASATRVFVIGASDKLAVDVYSVPELSQREVTVDLAGMISMPLVGPVVAAGLTPLQLSEAIAAKLRGSYVRSPRVSVNVVDVVSQTVTIDGEVRTPGTYPIGGRMTLLRAISRAEGTTEFTNQHHVVVYRTAANQKYAALYDLRAIREGAYDDPEIYANDVVVVGESQSRRVFKDVLSASGLITAPIYALLR